MKHLLTAVAATALAFGTAGAMDHHKSGKKMEAGYDKKADIAGVAMETEQLSTLVAAVKAAELVETLQGDGPFTVFAPTNDAFGDIQSTVDTLLADGNEDQLTKVLTAHVVAAELDATDLMLVAKANGGTVMLDTVSGDQLTVMVDGDTLTITDESGNTASVAKANVKAKNGIVHVVDTVLVPQV